MAAGDKAYWRVAYDFYGPVTGNGSITITTTALDDTPLRMPTRDEMRGIIQAKLAGDTGHPTERFTITFKNMFRLTENKDYLPEVQE